MFSFFIGVMSVITACASAVSAWVVRTGGAGPANLWNTITKIFNWLF